ncbi:DUF368 domain-containing protein [soil metagenome]
MGPPDTLPRVTDTHQRAPIRTTSAAVLAHYLRGCAMGSADIVPGVSGGTVALILGIYERLIGSIRAAASVPLAAARGDRRRARSLLREVEWALVLPLAAGIASALVVGAAVIPGLMERHPEGSRALFFGLIAAALPIPWRRVRARRASVYGIAAIAAAGAFALVGLPPAELAEPALPLVFAAASVAIVAMILPGVSGSFLLVIMGMYAPTLAAVNDRDLVYVAVFAAGAVVGLGLFARLLEWLLAHRHDATMAALVGLMVGSLRALWPWQDADRGLLAPTADGSAWTVVGMAVLGLSLITVLALVERRLDGADEAPAQRPAQRP